MKSWCSVRDVRSGITYLAQGQSFRSRLVVANANFTLSRYLAEADLPDKYECIICRLELAGKVSAEEIANVRNYLPTLTLERRALKKMYKKTKFENVHNMQREVGKSLPL
jgi:hypothetical protein